MYVGHMIYTLTSTTPPCLFTGDHLFLAGCGKPPPQLMRFYYLL